MTELQLRVSEGIENLLRQAQTAPGISEAVRQHAGSFLNKQEVSWQQLKAIGKEVQGANGTECLYQACQGSQMLLPKLSVRNKSKELQDRLNILQKQLDQKNYNRMVSEVTVEERKAESLRGGALRTFKQQISFGLHVLVMMGTFYVFGHVAGAAISTKLAVRAACGFGGMVIAMLLETVLLMLRTAAFEQPRASVLQHQQQKPANRASYQKKQL